MTPTSILGNVHVEPARPGGVFGIAVIFAAAAFASAVLVLMTVSGRLPLAAGAFLVGGGMETAGPLVFVLSAVLTLVTAAGLLRLANWARWLALAIAAWGMFQAVMPISSAVIDFRVAALLRESLGFVVRGVVVWYLLQAETRDAFTRRT